MSPIDARRAELVRDWLKSLGALCAGSMPLLEAQARISAYAPLLVAEFDIAAFSPDSLAAVARQCKFFPAYAELVEYLGGWWREHRPRPVALPAPQSGELSDSERDWVRYYGRRMAEQRPPKDVLSMVRDNGGKRALAEVLRCNPQHMPLARSLRWLTDDAELAERLGKRAVAVTSAEWVV